MIPAEYIGSVGQQRVLVCYILTIAGFHGMAAQHESTVKAGGGMDKAEPHRSRRVNFERKSANSKVWTARAPKSV